MNTSKPSAGKFRQFTRKHGITILMGIGIVILLVSPDAKSWVLRQLMVTGLFDAKMEKKEAGTTKDAALDFYFTDGAGNDQSTASLRGKVVFINFWASWCPPCRAEFPSIEKLYAAFRNNPDVFFLTINEDNDLSAAKAYLEKNQFTVPLYKTRGMVPESVYSGTLPTSIVLDKKGAIRYRHEGFANYGSDKFIQQVKALLNE